jgi:hypothetical protein
MKKFAKIHWWNYFVDVWLVQPQLWSHTNLLEASIVFTHHVLPSSNSSSQHFFQLWFFSDFKMIYFKSKYINKDCLSISCGKHRTNPPWSIFPTPVSSSYCFFFFCIWPSRLSFVFIYAHRYRGGLNHTWRSAYENKEMFHLTFVFKSSLLASAFQG